jgi:hypothetical protein
MELIPILSFIILVATISTFILAVGAYVLYKIRERKGAMQAAPHPKTVEAEIYAPGQVLAKPQEVRVEQQPAYQQQYYQKVPYDAQGRPGYIPVQQENYEQGEFRKVPGQRAYQQNVQAPFQQFQNENTSDDTTSTDKKFMKYTSEGYIPVSKTKTGENPKWR